MENETFKRRQKESAWHEKRQNEEKPKTAEPSPEPKAFTQVGSAKDFNFVMRSNYPRKSGITLYSAKK
jgi:hypothetical protein